MQNYQVIQHDYREDGDLVKLQSGMYALLRDGELVGNASSVSQLSEFLDKESTNEPKVSNAKRSAKRSTVSEAGKGSSEGAEPETTVMAASLANQVETPEAAGEKVADAPVENSTETK